MHNQSERKSYSLRKRTKATTIEVINPITANLYKAKIELRIF